MTTYVNCVPETPSISEVIGNANESLYGMNMNLPQNVSTPINNLQFQGIQPRTLAAHSGFVSGIQPIRHENMNFTIASPPSYMQLPQPRTQFHNQLQPQQTYEQQQHNIQTSNSPVINPMTINMIMITIHEINIKLEKLNLLDELNNRMSHMEQKLEKFDYEIKDMRNDLKQQSERLKNEEFHNSIIEDRMSKTENAKERLAWENNELREDILEMRCHSMKYNLLFSGIPEPSSWRDENTEEVVKEFIQKELDVDSTTMSFQNVHRLKQRTDETKTDKYDILNVPNGYNYFCKHRSAFDRKSGGLTIVYKENLKSYLKFHKTKSDFVQWVSISNELLLDDKELLLGCVYIPPENSKYASKEVFTEIEDELLHLQHNRCNIALLGDFNAKTRTLDDFVVPDDSLFEVLDNFDDNELLVYLFSEDTSSVNNYGYKLLDFCKRLNIYIGNSRLNGNDKSIGKKACKDVSLVDYFLISSNVFPCVKSFDVLDYNPLYSDVHCGLSVYLHSNVKKNTTKQNVGHCSKSNYIKWNVAKQDEFVEAIFSSQLSFGELDTIFNEECEGNQVKHVIDKAVNKIGEIFRNTVKSIFGFKNSTRKKVKPDNKPWYTKSCQEKRKQFNINRKKYNLRKSSVNKQILTRSGREYKKEMKKSYSEHLKKFETQLRNASKTDTKKFWGILKSFSKFQTSEENNITLDRLYEYFKDLNNNNEEASVDDFSEIYSQNDVDLLNSEITDDEIAYGGTGFFMRIKRLFYDLLVMVVNYDMSNWTSGTDEGVIPPNHRASRFLFDTNRPTLFTMIKRNSMQSLLIAVFVLNGIGEAMAEYKRVCYYTNRAQHRPNSFKYFPENIDPFICTHIIYSFGKICSSGWTTAWNDEHQVPYAYSGDQWVGYDNVRSVTIKAKYIKEKGLGGAMFWALDIDDFTGDACNEGVYP
ncbi:E3.2.1.14 [Mytilus coruscus]|uniref:E3.2.1.14 n=1 Tax=Mytilus coruscus TaxID=42192 RepID=A0A6J8BRZ5_MYTCO|nr:E3.2.1.14 [Mytilus coruscus]